MIVRSASCGAVPGTANLGTSVPRTASGTMPRLGTTSSGSGLPGRFRNSESVTSSILTSLPLGGEPREGFPLSGRVSGELTSASGNRDIIGPVKPDLSSGP